MPRLIRKISTRFSVRNFYQKLENTVNRGAKYKWKGKIYGKKPSVYAKFLRYSVRKRLFCKVSVRWSKHCRNKV